MSDKLCNRLTINYLQEPKAAFICIRPIKAQNRAHELFRNYNFITAYILKFRKTLHLRRVSFRVRQTNDCSSV